MSIPSRAPWRNRLFWVAWLVIATLTGLLFRSSSAARAAAASAATEPIIDARVLSAEKDGIVALPELGAASREINAPDGDAAQDVEILELLIAHLPPQSGRSPGRRR